MKVLNDTETFHFYNANPKNHRTGDCVIRAIATATGKSWDEVLIGLTETALKHKQSPCDAACYDKYLKSIGWVKHKQPRNLIDNTKFTGEEFCRIFAKDEPIIANIGGHHIVCIKERKVWDIWDSTGGCIGNYWTKE